MNVFTTNINSIEFWNKRLFLSTQVGIKSNLNMKQPFSMCCNSGNASLFFCFSCLYFTDVANYSYTDFICVTVRFQIPLTLLARLFFYQSISSTSPYTLFVIGDICFRFTWPTQGLLVFTYLSCIRIRTSFGCLTTFQSLISFFSFWYCPDFLYFR